MRSFARILLLALGPVLLGSGPADPDDVKIYTCGDGDGNVVFQTDPCPPVPEKKAEVTAPPVKKATAKPRRAGTPAAPPRRVTRWVRVPTADEVPAVPRRVLGKQTFSARLDGAREEPGFTTPEHTWRTFLAAIESSDGDGASRCLTPAALAKLGGDASALPLEALRTMVGTFSHIEDKGDLGPFWSIEGVRGHERPKWIFFEENAAGQWKISGI